MLCHHLCLGNLRGLDRLLVVLGLAVAHVLFVQGLLGLVLLRLLLGLLDRGSDRDRRRGKHGGPVTPRARGAGALPEGVAVVVVRIIRALVELCVHVDGGGTCRSSGDLFGGLEHVLLRDGRDLFGWLELWLGRLDLGRRDRHSGAPVCQRRLLELLSRAGDGDVRLKGIRNLSEALFRCRRLVVQQSHTHMITSAKPSMRWKTMVMSWASDTRSVLWLSLSFVRR